MKKGSNGREFDAALEAWDREVDGWRLRAARMLGDLVASETEDEVAAFAAREGAQGAPLEASEVITCRRVLENVYVAICEPTERRRELLRAALVAMGGEVASPSGPIEEPQPTPAGPRAGGEAAVPPAFAAPAVPTPRVVVHPGASPWMRPSPAEPNSELLLKHVGDDPSSSLDETSELDSAMFADLAPTPFERSAAEGQKAPFPRPSEKDVARDFAGETSTLDPADIADVVAAYPLPVNLPMSIERYAALVAQSEGASAEELADLHRDYGVADEAHRKRIDQEFSDALSRDATLRSQFADHLRQARDWVRRQRGAP